MRFQANKNIILILLMLGEVTFIPRLLRVRGRKAFLKNLWEIWYAVKCPTAGMPPRALTPALAGASAIAVTPTRTGIPVAAGTTAEL